MRRYRFTPDAKADLDRIWLHIARESSIEIANRFIDGITDRFPMLAAMPEAGKNRDELGSGMRSFPVRDYIVYYRTLPRGRILITRAIHGMRDQRKAWGEPSS